MSSLNKVMLIGRLSKDPEKRMTNSNQEVSTCSIAVNERFKDKNGQQQERVEFVNLVFWRRQSQILNQYCKKGSMLFIEGKLQTQSWDDPQGNKRYKTEVVVSNFQMLGSKGNSSENPNTSNNTLQNQNNGDSVGYNSEVPPYEDGNLPF